MKSVGTYEAAEQCNMHDACDHCYHRFTGIIHMVIKPGHILEQCCKCQSIRQVHPDHCHNHNDDWQTHKPTQWWLSVGNKFRARW
jgi:hypothetical protein